MRALMSYHPDWLRVGVETILGRRIPCSSSKSAHLTPAKTSLSEAWSINEATKHRLFSCQWVWPGDRRFLCCRTFR